MDTMPYKRRLEILLELCPPGAPTDKYILELCGLTEDYLSTPARGTLVMRESAPRTAA